MHFKTTVALSPLLFDASYPTENSEKLNFPPKNILPWSTIDFMEISMPQNPMKFYTKSSRIACRAIMLFHVITFLDYGKDAYQPVIYDSSIYWYC